MHFQPGGTVPRPAQSPIHSVSEARVHGFVVSPQPKNLGQRPAGWTASRPDTACYVCPRYVLPLSPARAGIPLNLAVPAAHRRASPSAASPPPPPHSLLPYLSSKAPLRRQALTPTPGFFVQLLGKFLRSWPPAGHLEKTGFSLGCSHPIVPPGPCLFTG